MYLRFPSICGSRAIDVSVWVCVCDCVCYANADIRKSCHCKFNHLQMMLGHSSGDYLQYQNLSCIWLCVESLG